MEYQKTEAVFLHNTLSKWTGVKEWQNEKVYFLKLQESRIKAFDQSEHSSVNCNQKKGINVPKSFADGSSPTYIIPVFLRNTILSIHNHFVLHWEFGLVYLMDFFFLSSELNQNKIHS